MVNLVNFSTATSTLTSGDVSGAIDDEADKIDDGDSYPTGGAISVPSSGSGDAFGAWIEIDASTSSSRVLKSLVIGLPSANALQIAEVEIGVGGSGSESAILRRIAVNPTSHSQVMTLKAPNISIDSGARVSARTKDSEASARNYVIGLDLV